MRVLFITTSFPLSAEDTHGTFVFRLARALAVHGVAVQVLAPHAPGVHRKETIGDVDVVRARYMFPPRLQKLAYGYGIPENLRASPLRLIQAPFLLVSLLLRGLRLAGRADVIHAHWTPAGAVAVLVGRLRRKPVVVTIWGSDVRSLSPSLNRWVLQRCDRVVGLSAEMQHAAARLGTEAISLPAPMDTDRFNDRIDSRHLADELGLSTRSPVIVFVGRLAREKGIDTLIEAVPHILARLPDARVLVVGEGMLRDSVESRLEELECANAVSLIGPRHDVERFLALADVFTTPSPIENVWSTTITEATLCGAPVVMTTAGHTTEVFTDGEDCRLVPPDDPVALAEALVWVIEHPKSAAELVANCSALHRRHGYDNRFIVDRHIELYADAIRRRKLD